MNGQFIVILQLVYPLLFLLSTARVMPTLPKQERPAREGARVASVETGLAAAAAKLAQQVSLTTEVTFYLVGLQRLVDLILYARN